MWYSQDIFVPLRHSHWDRERIRVLKSYPSCCLATLQDLVALCHSTWYKNLGALVPNPLVIGRMGRIKLASPSRLFLCQIWSFLLKPWTCRITKIGSAVSLEWGVADHEKHALPMSYHAEFDRWPVMWSETVGLRTRPV